MCQGKRRYLTRKEAKTVLRRQIAYGAGRPEEGRLTAYKCWLCDGFHLGHFTDGTQRAREHRARRDVGWDPTLDIIRKALDN